MVLLRLLHFRVQTAMSGTPLGDIQRGDSPSVFPPSTIGSGGATPLFAIRPTSFPSFVARGRKWARPGRRLRCRPLRRTHLPSRHPIPSVRLLLPSSSSLVNKGDAKREGGESAPIFCRRKVSRLGTPTPLARRGRALRVPPAGRLGPATHRGSLIAYLEPG